MRVLTAITKQTLRACIRSKVVLLLLALNLFAVFMLPLTVKGDGTAAAQLQVSLVYSLRTVTTLISLAALWIGGAGLAGEIEAYNMHLVLTKPAPRWQVWLGKWLGVFLMSGGVFVISAGLIYALAITRFKQGEFSAAEVKKVNTEILVGRKAYTPETLDFDALAQQEYQQRLAAGEFAEDHMPGAVASEIARQRKAASTSVPVGALKVWQFTGVRSPAADEPMFVRYRFYVDSKSIHKQRQTVGRWLLKNPAAKNPGEEIIATQPLKIMSGEFHEVPFPADFISDAGQVDIAYENLDPRGSSVVFQPADGPTLLIRATTFTMNWLRGMVVGLLRLALVSALGCVFGALFSTPVALFVALAYLVLGAILDPELGAPVRDVGGNIVFWRLKNIFSFSATQLVRLLVVSFRDFDVTHALARGYLISAGKMLRLIIVDGLFKVGPLVALGLWVFTRREIGKVIRR